MKYVKKCPSCDGHVIEKEVTEVLSGGINTAFIKVKVGVCMHCGERLYSPDLVKRFEEIESKLERKETNDFHAVGKSFQVI